MTTAAPPTTCAVESYARAVVAGEIVAGRLVRFACERHLRDLETGHERGLRWDQEAADRVLRFFPVMLVHFKGEWAGRPLELEPWQRFIVGSLFGWKRRDPESGEWVRRFRIALIEVARKNGKSTLASGIGNYLAFFDGEPGAEVYAAATKRDQAKIVWEEARRQVVAMIAAHPKVAARVTPLAHNLHSPATNSKFEPLGADADSTDGLNAHGLIPDELHAHKTRTLWDVLEEATASRRQSLLFAITTAGRDRASICREQYEYVVRVLEGLVKDDAYFGFVAELDEGDDPLEDESCWAKANPNLGVSVKIDYLRNKVARANELPGLVPSTLQKHFDVWVQRTATPWLDLELWDERAAAIDLGDFEGQRCFAGLYVASTTDLCALVLAFPDDAGGFDVFAFFWAPEAAIETRTQRDGLPYDAWAEAGQIEVTVGNVTDYDHIRDRLAELGERFEIEEIATARYNAVQLSTQLQTDGATVVTMTQGVALSPGLQEIERLISREREDDDAGGVLYHDGNDVLRWMAGNIVVTVTTDEDLKVDKDGSVENVAGMIALAMAVARAVAKATEPTPTPHIWLGGDDDDVYDED